MKVVTVVIEVTIVIVVTVVTVVTLVTVMSSEKTHTTSHFFYLLITLGKRNLTHLTADVMFSGQLFVILAIFF